MSTIGYANHTSKHPSFPISSWESNLWGNYADNRNVAAMDRIPSVQNMGTAGLFQIMKKSRAMEIKFAIPPNVICVPVTPS